MWKDLLTGKWKGPDVLLMNGRGYACVFPQDASTPIWIPERLVRHHVPKVRSSTSEETNTLLSAADDPSSPVSSDS